LERGQRAGLESLNCLAAALETDAAVLEYVQNLTAFHLNWITFVVVIPCLAVFNIYVTPEYLWVLWVVGGWGFGIALHAVVLWGQFGVFGPKWERRKIEERLNRGTEPS
jgi:hypothetical protein